MSEVEIRTRIYNLIQASRLGALRDENFKEEYEKDKQALEGILDLYQKEKEKNKMLEETMICEAKLSDGTIIDTVIDIHQKYFISKDKIRDKIKELENKIHIVIPNEYNKMEVINEFKNEGAINVLQELLEYKEKEN